MSTPRKAAAKAPTRRPAAKTARTAAEPPVPAELQFTSTGKAPTSGLTEQIGDIPFLLDGERMLAIKPKEAVLLLFKQAIDDPKKAEQLVDVFIDSCLDEASTGRVRQRIYGKRRSEDRLDINHMALVMVGVVKKWLPANRETRRAGARKQ